MRLGQRAQLQHIETVEPNLKMMRETAETERENQTPRSGSDARSSVGKHASGRPRSESGEPQMQRAATQSAGRFDGGRKRQEGKWRFTRCASSGPGTAKHRSGHGTARRNGKGPPDRSQPPDGTGRRNGRSGDESRFLREPPVVTASPMR